MPLVSYTLEFQITVWYMQWGNLCYQKLIQVREKLETISTLMLSFSLKTYPKCLGTRFIIKPSWRFNHFQACFPLKRNVSNNVLAACDAPSVFVPKRLWFLRRFNWQNVFPRRPPYQNSLINGEKVSCGPLGETDFRFRLKLKITLVDSAYPSQRPQCPSLSQHFLLFYRKQYNLVPMATHSFQVLTDLISIRKWFSAGKMLNKAANVR